MHKCFVLGCFFSKRCSETCLLCFAACIHTVGIIGPMFGFMLGSFLAKVYVDVGSVDLGVESLKLHVDVHSPCTGSVPGEK